MLSRFFRELFFQILFFFFLLFKFISNQTDKSMSCSVTQFFLFQNVFRSGYYMPARGYEFYLRVFIYVRYQVEHEKIKFISTSWHVIFCLLYKHTNNDVFDNSPKISDHFPKISEDFPKLFRRLDECLRTFPKISEEVPMMFRSYNTTSWVLFEWLCSLSNIINCFIFAIYKYKILPRKPRENYLQNYFKHSSLNKWIKILSSAHKRERVLRRPLVNQK